MMNDGTTFAELLDIYLADYLPQKSLGTQKQYRKILSKARLEFGTMALRDLTPTRLRAWRETLRMRLAPATVRTWMDIVSAPLTVAVDELEWLARNPMRKVSRPPAPPDRIRFLSDEERTALLSACKASSQLALYPIVLIALTTGARLNEIRTLRCRDVDLVQGVLRLEHTKNGLGRPLALPPRTVAALHAWVTTHPTPAPSSWLFPARYAAGPVHLTYAWDKARRQAGLIDFHFHDLRHTAASYLFMSGADIREVKEILGHKSLRMTMRYVHLALPHTRGVVERMAQQFLGEEG